jgi:anti-sigma regulatory factor (Ser/Thr protein kinase)
VTDPPLIAVRQDNNRLQLNVAATQDAVEPLRDAVTAYLAPIGLSARAQYGVELILEEALSNLAWHAFNQDPGPRRVDIAVEVRDDEVLLSLQDDGQPFDPLQAKAASRPKSLDEAQPGGLGLVLIRKFAKSVRYERRDSRNELAITVSRN